MKDFTDFLLHHYRDIALVIISVLIFVSMLIKRRPKSYDEFMTVLKSSLLYVPGFINDVEAEEGLTSHQKKELCLSLLLDFVQERLKRDLTEKELLTFFNSFSSYIEKVLDTPTKKGGPGRDEEVE